MKAEKHILPSFGEKLIDSITQKDIYNFIEIVNNTWHISNKDYEAKRAMATVA